MKSFVKKLHNSNFVKIVLFLILISHTNSILNFNSHLLGENNICSSDEKDKMKYSCEDNCLCDRDFLDNEFKTKIFLLSEISDSKPTNIKIKKELIEQKSNSPPIFYLF